MEELEDFHAKAVCEKIKAYNVQSITFEGMESTLYLHVSVVQFIGRNMKYRDLFEQLYLAILDSKNLLLE